MKNRYFAIWIPYPAIAMILTLFFLAGFCTFTSFAHTKEESIYLSGNWQKDENGWRFFKQYDLSFPTGQWTEYQGHSYYFMDNGYMATGWHFLNKSWYYFNPTKRKTEGAIVCGWIHDPEGGGWFYTNSNGIMITGWRKIGSYWYYFNPDSDGTMGLMAANCVVDDSYLDSNGHMNEMR